MDKITVQANGSTFEVEIVDPTHITMVMVGGTGIPWAYHVAQLDGSTVAQLQAQGVMDSRRYLSLIPESLAASYERDCNNGE